MFRENKCEIKQSTEVITSFRESVFATLGGIYFLDFTQKGKNGGLVNEHFCF